MPRVKFPSKKKSPKRRPPREVPQSTIVYRGSITTPVDKREQDCHTTVLRYVSAPIVSSVISGNLATHVGSSPANCAGWSNYAAIYDEYRTLGVEFVWIPSQMWSTSLLQAPFCLVVDNDNSTDLTSYAAAALYASCKTFHIMQRAVQTARMNETSDATFQDAQSPVDYYSIKMFSTGLTANTAYGYVIATFRVQFRGTGAS